MGFPIPIEVPDMRLRVDVSGNNCTCCSNNSSKERVVYDREHDRFVVVPAVKKPWALCRIGCVSSCCSSGAEKQENAETWKKIQDLLSEKSVPVPQVAEEARIDIQKNAKKGKRVKPEDLEKLTKAISRKVVNSHQDSRSAASTQFVEMSERTS